MLCFVSRMKAMNYVLGYAIGNDSIRFEVFARLRLTE
jgi:hypothetical protein